MNSLSIYLSICLLSYLFLGFCDALKFGHSTKAALLRQGLEEIGEFCHMISPSTFKVLLFLSHTRTILVSYLNITLID